MQKQEKGKRRRSLLSQNRDSTPPLCTFDVARLRSPKRLIRNEPLLSVFRHSEVKDQKEDVTYPTSSSSSDDTFTLGDSVILTSSNVQSPRISLKNKNLKTQSCSSSENLDTTVTACPSRVVWETAVKIKRGNNLSRNVQFFLPVASAT